MEKLIRIYGFSGNYRYQEFEVPMHREDEIYIRKPEAISDNILTEEILDEFEDKGIISIWDADLINRGVIEIDIWILARKNGVSYIPTKLTLEDGYLVGKKTSDNYHFRSYLILIIYMVILMALSCAIAWHFLPSF